MLLLNLTGNITGLPSEQLGKVEFEFTVPEGSVYIPEMNIDRQTGSYTLQVEKGVEYQVAALNVNDYTLDSQVLSAEEDATLNLNFTAKPTYAITINLTGATAEDLANATFVFTNLNEEGYVYTFIGTENIALRDGVYSVKVENTGAYNQLLTSNLKVEGEATAKTIDFTAEPITILLSSVLISFNSGIHIISIHASELFFPDSASKTRSVPPASTIAFPSFSEKALSTSSTDSAIIYFT